MSTLGVTAGMNYERSLYQHSPAVMDTIKEITVYAVDKAFRNEIIATISS